MTDDTARSTGGDIHRLLDDAFAGVEMTPDAQDLKEEVRANLLARVAELEASGVAPADAAPQAISELGDVRALLVESGVGPQGAPSTGWAAQVAALQRYKVRPKPRFVVGVVVASLAIVIGLVLVVLAVVDLLPLPIGAVIGLLGIVSTGAAWLVGDSLAQETTTNHPMPTLRAGGYFFATLLATYGLGFGALVIVGELPVWTVVFAALGVVAAIVLFAILGSTQTNRHKAWTRRAFPPSGDYPGSRFETEPDTAARFGIYTAVIWIVAFVVFLVLSFTIGWAWSWLAFVGGFVLMMLTLARMLFGPPAS
jgi:hypothetical protein